MFTRKMKEASANVTCQIPLSSVDECQYKQCDKKHKIPKTYEVKERHHLQVTDTYWAEFLRAQAQSTANYLYKIEIYGHNRDPTLVKKEPFPPQLIHQRLQHLPPVGALDKVDMFYMLSFLLNLLQLKAPKQRVYMELLQAQGLVDNEILNYMRIIARHPNAGITPQMLEEFLLMTGNLMNSLASPCALNYFQPDRIFMKSMAGEMDPYELAYLKGIMDINEEALGQEEFLYLLNFVERLREMPTARREKYLKVLNDQQVLPSSHFPFLQNYLKRKGNKFNSHKLSILMAALEALMDIQPCFPPPIEEPLKEEPAIEIDPLKIQKALQSLMKGGIPNIVKVMDLKKFLKDVMLLKADPMEQTLNQLKNLRLVTVEQFKFILDFMANEKLAGEMEKKRLLMKILQKVASTAPSAAISVVLAIPPLKGPKPTETSEPAKNDEGGKSKVLATVEGTKSKSKLPTEGTGKVMPSKEGTTQEDKNKNKEKDNKDQSTEKSSKEDKDGSEKKKPKTKKKK